MTNPEVRAYAATLPPQAAPVAEGKPDFEREAREFCAGLSGYGESTDALLADSLVVRFERIWTVARAAAEAEIESLVGDLEKGVPHETILRWHRDRRANPGAKHD